MDVLMKAVQARVHQTPQLSFASLFYWLFVESLAGNVEQEFAGMGPIGRLLAQPDFEHKFFATRCRPPAGVLPILTQMLIAGSAGPSIGFRLIPQPSQLACHKRTNLWWNHFQTFWD